MSHVGKKYLYLLTFTLLLMSSTPAFAYVEPGTGNLILQLLFGVAAGVGLLFKLYWNRIFQALGFRKIWRPKQNIPAELPVNKAPEDNAEQRDSA